MLCCGWRSGSHTVRLNLTLIPKRITQMFFVISSWLTSLEKIRSPWIRFSDDETKTELCRYDLEQKQQAACVGFSAVLMARLSRNASTGRWFVVAFGCVAADRLTDWLVLLQERARHWRCELRCCWQ